MKNLHLIPTEKPSRLGYLTKKGKEVYKDLRLFEKPMPIILDSENLHIYITSEEEIKEGDWIISDQSLLSPLYDAIGKIEIISLETKKIIQSDNSWYWTDLDCKKIILTTDPDLIADGVQAIDDEFLKWFVKNPSCVEVKTRKIGEEWIYNADVPQEEPKQETLEEAGIIAAGMCEHLDAKEQAFFIAGFIESTKWQAERMYSEEDLKEAFRQGQDNIDYSDTYGWSSKLTEQEWFEQFKKK